MSCTDKMYLTGNPICSDNPRDLSDNARVFDAYVNSAEFSVTDRFGVERVTLAWAKWRIDTAIDEATGEIRAEWQTGVANINSEETAALNNINTTTTASLDGINNLTSSATSDISTLRDSSLASIEEAKDNAIEEIIETGGTTIVQEPGQDTNKVMSQKAVTSYVDAKIVDIDTSNLVTKDDITNELGDSTELVASQALVSSHGLGYGQTWSVITDEIRIGVNYTNNSRRPIMINIRKIDENGNVMLFVDGVHVVYLSGVAYAFMGSVIVPPGSTYRVELALSNAPGLIITALR